jgi:hypothetical protein
MEQYDLPGRKQQQQQRQYVHGQIIFPNARQYPNSNDHTDQNCNPDEIGDTH